MEAEPELDFEDDVTDNLELSADPPAKSPVPEPVVTEDQEDGECEDKEKEVQEVEVPRELEEGECSDDDNKHLDNESKPVCKFYNKGQCTWGANCRFMHPGVTDKGNYNMFGPERPTKTEEKENKEPNEEEVS